MLLHQPIQTPGYLYAVSKMGIRRNFLGVRKIWVLQRGKTKSETQDNLKSRQAQNLNFNSINLKKHLNIILKMSTNLPDQGCTCVSLE